MIGLSINPEMRPRFGVLPHDAPRTAESINQLKGRGGEGRATSMFRLKAEGNNAFWYAYPASYGRATFYETDLKGNIVGVGSGGWDGAHGDATDPTKWGPMVVDMTIDGKLVPFFLYITDWPGLGMVSWRAE